MEDLAEAAIKHALKLGAEFVDLRMELVNGTNIVVMDGKTKTLLAQQESGCGLRAFIGGAWGFSATNMLTMSSLRSAASSAVRMAKVARSRAKTQFSIPSMRPVKAAEEYRCKEKPSDVSVEEKVMYALSIDKSMSSMDARIASTSSRYDDFEAERVVANSFGTLVRTKERWVLATCSAWSRSEGITQRGHKSIGSVGGYELMRTDKAVGIGTRAAAQALRLLDSKPVPAGKFTVIIDNDMTGVLAHEAFGHACEADGVLAGSSVLEGRIGQRVASNEITLIDDPTIKNSFGYFSVDWEGVKAKKHVLIDKGVLRHYLHSIETSSRMHL
ncbi:MAG: TldD/PmbA family protein, partial [Thermoplasmata archaeon]